MKSVSVQVVSCCVYDKPIKNVFHMHGNIPYMFDCWADPVVHLQLKSSMAYLSTQPTNRLRQKMNPLLMKNSAIQETASWGHHVTGSMIDKWAKELNKKGAKWGSLAEPENTHSWGKDHSTAPV